MYSRKFIGIIFLITIICTCDWNESPSGPDFLAPVTPQWGMFGRNPRHTNNINTPDELIVGPQGPQVQILWSFEADGNFYGSPSIGDDGTIYFGTYRIATETHFYALNPDGTLKWKYLPLPNTYGTWSTPAIGDDGTIYFCGHFSGLYALNPDGSLKWHVPASLVVSSPAIGSDGTIFFSSATGSSTLKAINPDGTIRWELDNVDSWNSPTVNNDNIVYCQVRRNGDDAVAAINNSGEILWDYILDESATIWGITMDQLGYLYFYIRGAIYSLKPDGKLNWKHEMYIGEFVVPSINMYGDIIFPASRNELLIYNRDGERICTIPLNEQINELSTVDSRGRIYIGAISHQHASLYCYSRFGELQWVLEGEEFKEEVYPAPAISRDGTLYFGFWRGETKLFAVR